MSQPRDYSQVGTPLVIAGRYRVRGCLHSGSTCSVFVCSDSRSPHKLLAVKVLSKSFGEDSAQLKRFREEMMLSTSVEHPNVVRAIDSFEQEDLIGFATEYARGGDLADYLAHHRRVPLPRAIRLIKRVAEGLHAIHKAGLIHRDLKPENILIFDEERFKVADLGVACMYNGLGSVNTDEILGTFDYISPEVIQRGEVSPRIDIYALGVLAYEIITGTCPFQGAGTIETLRNQLVAEPIAPSRLNVDCTPLLDRVILRALARDPRNRFPDMQSFLLELNQVDQIDCTRKVISADLIYDGIYDPRLFV